MSLHHQRIPGTFLIIKGIEQQTFNGYTVFTLPADIFLGRQLKVNGEIIKHPGDLFRCSGPGLCPYITGIIPFVDGERMSISLIIVLPATEGMLAGGEWRIRLFSDIDDHDLTVHPHIDQKVNGICILTPSRPLDSIRKIGYQGTGFTAGSRHEEQVAIIVGLEIGIRPCCKQHLPVISGDRDAPPSVIILSVS